MKNRGLSLQELMEQDIERSGIPLTLVEKLGFKALNREATAKYLGKRYCGASSYKIPFFDHKGERVPFARLRLLRGKWHSDNKKSTFKYNQKKNTSPRLYFPPNFKWPMKKGKIRLNYLCITEGEKKAIKACMCGIPTVALSGVFNFKSSKRNVSLIDEFRLFDFSECAVDICYDSDTYSNNNVVIAMNQLSSELMTLQPSSLNYVYLKGNNRIGLDDFLANYKDPAKAYDAFFSLERKADERLNAMSAFNQQLCFIETQERFYSKTLRKFYHGRQGLVDQYDNLPKIPDPADMRKRISPIKLWFEQRGPETNYYDVTYAPNKPQEFIEDHKRYVNTWVGTALARVDGEPTLWLELFDHLTKHLDDEERRWFMQWLAYPIQHPGTKLFSSVFIHSHATGIGKNFLVEPFIKAIYGTNYTRQDGSVIEGSFNGWVARKQFVFMDEIHLTLRAERITAMNKLKSLITNETVDVNEKYQPALTFPNHANFYLASNYSDALMLDEKERRTFVIRGPDSGLGSAFYAKLHAFAHDDMRGIGQVYNYLLNFDTSDFRPTVAPPFTKAREEVIQHSSDNLTYLVGLVKREPSAIFSMDGKLPDKELYTAAELSVAMNTHAQKIGMPKTGVSPDAMGRYLTNAGLVSCKHISCRIGDSVTSISLYAIFKPREWRERPKQDWLLHYKIHDERFEEELKRQEK